MTNLASFTSPDPSAQTATKKAGLRAVPLDRQYSGPVRRDAAQAIAPQTGTAIPGWIMANVLDSIDHGILVVSLTSELVFANRSATADLDAGKYFLRSGSFIAPHGNWSTDSWCDTLSNLHSTKVRLCDRNGTSNGEISLMRLAHPHGVQQHDLVLIGLGRDSVCSQSALDAWAKRVRLTKSEQRIVSLIAVGEQPKTIAQLLDISENTVRTHIRRVLEKARLHSMRELINTLAVMPVFGRAAA